MYLTNEKADEIINDFKRDIIDDYKSRLLFLTGLITDDDWVFVIKDHSLIEALMNELIEEYIQKPELKDIIGRFYPFNFLSEIELGRRRFIFCPFWIFNNWNTPSK